MSLFFHHERDLKDLQKYMREELDKMELLIEGVCGKEDLQLKKNLLKALQDTRVFFRVSLKFLDKKIRGEDGNC